jgi:hypothetical protein
MAKKSSTFRFRRTQTIVDCVDIKADTMAEAIRIAEALTGCKSWLEPRVTHTELEVSTIRGYGRKGFCKIYADKRGG